MALLVVAGEIDLSIAATVALASLAMGPVMKAGDDAVRVVGRRCLRTVPRNPETTMTPLRQRMIDAMVLRGFAARTQETYLIGQISQNQHRRGRGVNTSQLGPSRPPPEAKLSMKAPVVPL